MPKTIKIIGVEWELIEDQNVANEGDNFGSCHTKTQRIFIEKDQKPQMKEVTLVHEILHAVFWQTGLSQRFKAVTGITEEEIVSSIDSALREVIKNNQLF